VGPAESKLTSQRLSRPRGGLAPQVHSLCSRFFRPQILRNSQKYKRCCSGLSATKPTTATAGEPKWVIEDDGLDDLSNSVLALIKERRFDEALDACKRLLAEFPEVHDGFDRSGMVHAAIGNHALAADFFRSADAFASDPARRADYDGELVDDWRLKAEEQERLAAEGERASPADPERAP